MPGSDPTRPTQQTLPGWMAATYGQSTGAKAPKKLPELRPKAVLDALAESLKTTPETMGSGLMDLGSMGMLGLVKPLYHGSGKLFTKFADKAGTGRGTSYYGHGTYATPDRATALEYVRPGGALYEVEVPAFATEDFLDVTKLLRHQSPAVRSRLETALARVAPQAQAQFELSPKLIGSPYMNVSELRARVNAMYGGGRDFMGHPQSVPETSRFLREAGVPGIYVPHDEAAYYNIFDPADLRITGTERPSVQALLSRSLGVR